MTVKLLMIDEEVLTVFCKQCKCCLADNTHCGTCHTSKTIKTLCGCGECVEKAEDYLAREKARQARLAANRRAQGFGLLDDE